MRGVAAGAELARARAGEGGLERLGDVAHGQADVRDLPAVDADFLLRHALLARELDVRHATHAAHDLGGQLRETPQRRQIVTPHLDLEALLGAEHALQQELALRRARAHLHARNGPGEDRAQIVGDFDVRALARGGRDERESDLALRGRLRVTARGADGHHGGDALGHRGEDQRFQAPRLAVDYVEPRADFHLARDPHLALVAGRHVLAADPGHG